MVLFGRNGESPVPVVAALLAVGLLRRGDRGGAHRAQVPHAGVPALGRVPRERLRAVAPARRRRRCPTSRSTFATEPNFEATSSCRTCATSRRSRGRGRCRARRASSIAIGGLEKADRTGNISYDPENHDLMTRLRAQKVAGIAGDIPELEVDDPGRRRDGARARLGRHVRPDRGRLPPRARGRHARSRTRTCAISIRSRATRARCCAATTRCSIPEMNLGQLLKLVRARVPRRRGRLQPRHAACRCARPRSRTAIEALVDAA